MQESVLPCLKKNMQEILDFFWRVNAFHWLYEKLVHVQIYHLDFLSNVLGITDIVYVMLFQNRFKFTGQIRNPQAAVQGNVMQAPPQSVVIPGQEPLTATMLAAAPPQEQKQVS